MGDRPSTTLARITDTILDPGSDPLQLREAVGELHALCSTIAGMTDEPDHADVDRETRLEQGRALSPRDAARCVLDVARTTAFLRGIHDAVVDAQRYFGGRRINLLYAGCGPFAPLALPLATRFTADELGLTLLDAHQWSVDSVNRLAEPFAIGDRIVAVRRCDASTYVHPPSDPIHVLVIETMQKALEHEPQVALTLHLAPQLAPGGILVPETVRITACLADLGREFSLLPADSDPSRPPPIPDRRRIEVGTILELTAESSTSGHWRRMPEGPSVLAVLEVPAVEDDRLELMVRTSVEVYGTHRLGDYDSGITHPSMMRHLGPLIAGDRLEFGYRLGSSPGLTVTRASTP